MRCSNKEHDLLYCTFVNLVDDKNSAPSECFEFILVVVDLMEVLLIGAQKMN